MSTRLDRERKALADKAAELRREAETCDARAKWLDFIEEHGAEGVKVLREVKVEATRQLAEALDRQVFEGTGSGESFPGAGLWPGDWHDWNARCHLSGLNNFTGGFLRWLGWRPEKRKGGWA